MLYLYNLICCSYLNVSSSILITSVGEEICFSCYCLLVIMLFLFSLWMLGKGCVFLVWHSLCHPYNYLTLEIFITLTAKMAYSLKVKLNAKI